MVNHCLTKQVFSTGGRKGGIVINKNGNLTINWKESDQLLPSEIAVFREGVTNLLRKFQSAGAEIEEATFVAGDGKQLNLTTPVAAGH